MPLFLRNLLTFAVLLAIALGVGYVYSTNAPLVWGSLLLCAACFLLQRRAQSLFGQRNPARVPVAVRERNR